MSELSNLISYDILFSYGDHYWVWDVLMDCSKTPDGLFEVKGFLDGYEKDINQYACEGDSNAVKASSRNHVAR